MKALNLAGLIFNSATPETLARFYRDALGVPLSLQSHGPIRDHYEGDFAGVHFAILRRQPRGGGAVVPSFACANLEMALADLGSQLIKPLHPIIKLGGGKQVCSIADPEGNIIRLFQQTSD